MGTTRPPLGHLEEIAEETGASPEPATNATFERFFEYPSAADAVWAINGTASSLLLESHGIEGIEDQCREWLGSHRQFFSFDGGVIVYH